MLSDGGNNYIKITESKTIAGERKIPISDRLLASGLSDFMQDKKGQIFKYNLRLGRGSGNAVGKKFKRHLEELKLDREKLVFHSLRKFCNNFLKENEVPYEVRCQFIGHEIEDINNTVYSNNYSVDRLGEILSRSIFNLELMAGIIKTKF
jgi:integrase